MPKTLIDVMPFKYQIVEDNRSDGRMVVSGVIQREGVKNENGRIYPTGMFNKKLGERKVKDRLVNRGMFGELDHPNDGKTSLKRVSHIMTNAWVDDDGTVNGEAEILDTPNGKVLQELFRRNCRVGISSRGSGSLGKQQPIVQDDYRIDTWDFVANPSTPGAFPEVAEALNEDVDDYTTETAMPKLSEIRNYVKQVKEDIANAEHARLVEYALRLKSYERHLQKIGELDDSKIKDISSILSEVIGDLQNEIEPKVDKIYSGNLEGGVTMPDDATTTVEVPSVGINVKLEEIQAQIEALREDNEAGYTLEQRYAGALAIIEELRGHIRGLVEHVEYQEQYGEAAQSLVESLLERTDEGRLDVPESLEKSGVVAETLLQGMIERYSELSEAFDDLEQRHDASRSLIEAVIQQNTEDSLASYIEESLAQHPLADKVAPLLMECQTLAEAQERMSLVESLTEGIDLRQGQLEEDDDDGFYDEDLEMEPLPSQYGPGKVSLTEEEFDQFTEDDQLFGTEEDAQLHEGVVVADKVRKKLRWK